MGGAEFRPRPFGRPNFSPDGVGRGSGNGQGDKPFTLLPGATPLGEEIVKRRRRTGARRQTEQAKPTLGEEINAYLEERARLRAEGQLTNSFDGKPIITPADAMSIDLLVYTNELEIGNHPENRPKWRSVDRIGWGFNALAFGRMNHEVQAYVTVGCEFEQGWFRNHPEMLEDTGRLNGEETAILAELLHKVGLPFEPRPQGITIPFAPTVKKMREIVGGEPLWEIPAPGDIPDGIDRYR